mgnify:CR=1 FL=1
MGRAAASSAALAAGVSPLVRADLAAAAFATLVLNGKLSVLAGRDHFRAEAGPWTVLGAELLCVALRLGQKHGHKVPVQDCIGGPRR